MSDGGTGLAEAMLGLDGVRIVAVTETADELTITVETTTVIEGCSRCGTRAQIGSEGPQPVNRTTTISAGTDRFGTGRQRQLGTASR